MSWEALAGSAAAGELYLEHGTARQCAERCAEMAERLRWIRSDAEALTKVTGFGDRLPSGIALATKFERKASGGEYSLDQALADHIAEIERMRDVFLAIENRYAAAEEANTAVMTKTGSAIE